MAAGITIRRRRGRTTFYAFQGACSLARGFQSCGITKRAVETWITCRKFVAGSPTLLCFWVQGSCLFLWTKILCVNICDAKTSRSLQGNLEIVLHSNLCNEKNKYPCPFVTIVSSCLFFYQVLCYVQTTVISRRCPSDRKKLWWSFQSFDWTRRSGRNVCTQNFWAGEICEVCYTFIKLGRQARQCLWLVSSVSLTEVRLQNWNHTIISIFWNFVNACVNIFQLVHA